MKVADPAIAARDLRDHFGLFPTGVAVVTATAADGSRLGNTVSSFTSVSLDPPLVSFNLSVKAKSLELWRGVEGFVVNVLGEEQADLSTRFARTLVDKWEGVATSPGVVGSAPLFPGALACFECASHAILPAGDHVIVLGRVEAMRRDPRATARPLLFFASKYRKLADDHGVAPARYDEDVWVHGW